MIKYVTAAVTFEEIPLEVTLSLTISNCCGACRGCHSPELREDIGAELTPDVLDSLIRKNEGITCVLFLGEGNCSSSLRAMAERVRNHWGLKVALYSGRVSVEPSLASCFDYIKVGPYVESLGPLNKVTTNQRLYQYSPFFSEPGGWRNITDLFWKHRE